MALEGINFWKRLEMFVENVQVNDPMSEEEKEMILIICKRELAKQLDVVNSLLAPSVEKRVAFAEDLIEKTDDGKITIPLILAVTYWMQAEMINLNKQ